MKTNAQQAVAGACLLLLISGCNPPVSKPVGGTLAGSALGASAGGGPESPDVAVGSGLGALGGALSGTTLDRMDQENAGLEAQIRKNEQLVQENARLIEELRKHGADARSSKRGVVINLPDMAFLFDRAELTPEGARTLTEISRVLGSMQHRSLSVEGHTDSVGTVVYNKNLSEKRAQSVSRELTKHGIPAERMTVKGFGEGHPIATNNSEEGRARNRRVEIIVENY